MHFSGRVAEESVVMTLRIGFVKMRAFARLSMNELSEYCVFEFIIS